MQGRNRASQLLSVRKGGMTKPISRHVRRLMLVVRTGMLMITVGCDPTPAGGASSASPNPIEAHALKSLATLRGEKPEALDRKALKIQAETSSVVPHLTYYRAVYAPAQTTHMSSTVVLARGDSLVIDLRTPRDLQMAAHGWHPATADAAKSYCAELVTHVGPAGALQQLPVVLAEDNPWKQLGFTAPGPPWRDRITRPEITQPVPREWIVRLWVSEPGRLVKYECTLAASRTPQLMVADSIMGAGIPPGKP